MVKLKKMNFKSKLLLFFFTICLYSSLLSQNHNGSYLSTQFQFVDSEGVNGPLKSLKTVITVNVVGFQGYNFKNQLLDLSMLNLLNIAL